MNDVTLSKFLYSMQIDIKILMKNITILAYLFFLIKKSRVMFIGKSNLILY